MQSPSTSTQAPGSSTITLQQSSEAASPVKESPTIKIKLRKPKSKKGIKWDVDTVDNENMGKKKSKCCCIYNPPEPFVDPSQISSSSSDSDSDSDSSEANKQKIPHGAHKHSHGRGCDFHDSPSNGQNNYHNYSQQHKEGLRNKIHSNNRKHLPHNAYEPLTDEDVKATTPIIFNKIRVATKKPPIDGTTSHPNKNINGNNNNVANKNFDEKL